MIGNRVFVNEDDFEVALQELKITDEPIVLGDDGKAYYYMPGDVHSAATSHIVKKFYSWSHDMKGRRSVLVGLSVGVLALLVLLVEMLVLFGCPAFG